MSIRKHTAGPWMYRTQLNGTIDFHGDGGNRLILSCARLINQEANARLIAAAPELLAEMEKVVRFLADLNGCEWIKGDGPGEVDMRQRAKALHPACFAAIVMATGGQP